MKMNGFESSESRNYYVHSDSYDAIIVAGMQTRLVCFADTFIMIRVLDIALHHKK